jgi:hypothetical protein
MSCYAATRFRHDHSAMLFCLSSCRNALAAITLELTRRERAAHNLNARKEHESHAIERSG